MSPAPLPTPVHAWIDRLAPPATAIAMAAAMMAPRGTSSMLVILAILPVVVLAGKGAVAGLRPVPALLLGLLAFGAYLAVNATWSIDHAEAFGKVAYYVVLLAIGHLAACGMARMDDPMLDRLARGALIGILVGAAFLLIEILSGQWIKRTVFNLLPWIRPDPKHVIVTDGRVTRIGAYVLNRSFAVLCLSLWPALMIARASLPAPAARLVAGLLVACTTIGIFASVHETSMLAIAFSALAFAGMVVAPRIMRPLIVAGWIAATLAIVPIASLSFQAGLHQAQWLPETGRNRIILWGVTAQKVREAPLLGIGVAATKELNERAQPTAEKPKGFTYPLSTGRHSHNIFMQTWYELGAVGAVLLLIVGLLLLHRLSRLPDRHQPYAWAGFTAAVITGAFNWGMWQTWFMAAFGIWAVLTALALERQRRAD